MSLLMRPTAVRRAPAVNDEDFDDDDWLYDFMDEGFGEFGGDSDLFIPDMEKELLTEEFTKNGASSSSPASSPPSGKKK